MEEQKKFVAAKKVLQKLDRIFRFANRNDYCKHNPAVLLKGDVITPKKKNQPALEESDLPEFLKKLDDMIDTLLGYSVKKDRKDVTFNDIIILMGWKMDADQWID